MGNPERPLYFHRSIDKRWKFFSIYGRDDGANFLDQSQREIMLNRLNPK